MPENFEDKDEAFTEMACQADELDKLEDDLRSRLLSDDVPNRVADDIDGEFGPRFK